MADDVSPATKEPLPNLWAAGLASYAFEVRTAMGQKPMRYLLSRRFGGSEESAVTVLFVDEPAVLSGTYVHVSENRRTGACVVHTYLPTMAKPLRIAERLLFDCLPLTDVGYVDLMAWLPPALRPADDGTRPAGGARSFRFDGDPAAATLWVHEQLDPGLSVVVRRVFRRDGQDVRRWEVTEPGEPGLEALPRRIRVSRPLTGHETEFHRSSPVTAVAPALFDGPPATLRSEIAAALEELPGRTPAYPAAG